MNWARTIGALVCWITRKHTPFYDSPQGYKKGVSCSRCRKRLVQPEPMFKIIVPDATTFSETYEVKDGFATLTYQAMPGEEGCPPFGVSLKVRLN